MPAGSVPLSNIPVRWFRSLSFSDQFYSNFLPVHEVHIAKPFAISTVYGMLASKDYKAKRRKHELRTNKGPMFVTKLLVNEHPARTRKEKSAIRAGVFQLEQRARAGDVGMELKKEYRRSLGRVCKLTRFHKVRGEELMTRLKALRPFIG